MTFSTGPSTGSSSKLFFKKKLKYSSKSGSSCSMCSYQLMITLIGIIIICYTTGNIYHGCGCVAFSLPPQASSEIPPCFQLLPVSVSGTDLLRFKGRRKSKCTTCTRSRSRFTLLLRGGGSGSGGGKDDFDSLSAGVASNLTTATATATIAGGHAGDTATLQSHSPHSQPNQDRQNQQDAETSAPLLESLLTEPSTTKRQYNWTEFFPRFKPSRTSPTSTTSTNSSSTTTNSKGQGRLDRLSQIVSWLSTGSSPLAAQSNDQTKRNFASLARLLILLRTYESQFGFSTTTTTTTGMEEEEQDLHSVQRQVLAEITMDLYSSGTPTWVLEQVMERVAEGLTGKPGVQFMLLPRRCFIFYPNAKSDLFRIVPGFDICKLGAVEQVAVRLASFASNTKSSERLNTAAIQMPTREELQLIKQQAEQQQQQQQQQLLQSAGSYTKEQLATEILNLASSTFGLFFFLNNPNLQTAVNATTGTTTTTTTTATTANTIPNTSKNNKRNNKEKHDDDPFWQVQDSTRDLFASLAATEAYQALTHMREHEKQLYSLRMISLFRILSSAGACAMWFGGSVHDMMASSLLAITVAYIGTSNTIRKNLVFEERVLTEVVASFLVGFVGGVLAIQWPDKFCFGAIAVASVMDLLQGFKVVYAVIEVMSKNIVTGTARLMEGVLFTGLISYSLKCGLDVAFRLMLGGVPDYDNMLVSVNGISGKLFPLILPFVATAWSGLFRPNYDDLPLMAFHGILAFALNWAGAPMFVAAMCVTFSAGIISRFTGREALGNTLAGLYALVPGTYMVRALLSPNRVNFIESVLFAAATIGLGGWTGTILCAPTILGKSSWGFSRQRETKQKKQTMLYF